MKILFDLTPIHDHLTGVERYNINITKEIITNHMDDSYILLFKSEIHEEFVDLVQLPNVSFFVIPACNKLFFIQFRLLSVLNKIDADYYVFLSFTSPVLFNKKKIVNAIHDLTCWDCPDSILWKMKLYYRFTYWVAIKKSWKIVTVSKFSQSRICTKYKLSTNNVPIVYDGLTEIFREKKVNNIDVREKYHLPSEYILSLSTIEPRKNLQLLINAYMKLAESYKNLPDLVLAGREGWKLDEIVNDNYSNEIYKKIHFTGFIEDNDLPSLYKNAELFVFPSKYEGFGLPLIEAMSQGTLVISSDAASMPEVVQGAGMLFKSNDKDDLIRALQEGLNMSNEEKNKRIELGKTVSYSYSWEKEAEKLYILLVEGSNK